MRVTYDPEVDVLDIVFGEGPVSHSEEEGRGVVVDYDDAGRLIAIEILRASTQLRIPQSVEYSVAS
jgi:YD repeat-containing protein